MIINCSCHNSFQDLVYGKGRRVGNQLKNKIDYRCTVCSKVHNVGNKPILKVEKTTK